MVYSLKLPVVVDASTVPVQIGIPSPSGWQSIASSKEQALEGLFSSFEKVLSDTKMDLSKINLLDKINLHFKIPTAVSGLFEFNDIEQSFVDRIEKVKKFMQTFGKEIKKKSRLNFGVGRLKKIK